ncbi:IS110 family transposase [Nakamurella sp. PAMC28650]|uniref:IS110 family transposase n=1 Tax=Nakamurella sp. PAMC28650 TaxID=2762325 RepID=UPI00164DBD31|nr:IS110 family transposase [Nakamurella sp. PAMC28650]QNK80310.1 IS110 family transposase [Nakamurella sp. PAMC28650]
MIVAEERTAARICAGVDWAKDDHAVCIVGDDGEALQRFMINDNRAGLKDMVRRLLDAAVQEVGIERPDGTVVQALLAAGLTVLVIPPAQVKGLRSRYGSAGNKDDRFDAYVLADVVRTDRRRLRPLQQDTAATTALRTTVRARRDLVVHRVAAANQLRAHLQIVFPAAATLFAAIDSDISLLFLAKFTTQEQADRLSVTALAAWLASVSYSGGTDPAVLYAKIVKAPRGTTEAAAAAHAVTTGVFIAVLRTLNTQIRVLADAIGAQLDAHPDKQILTSLPRSGCVRAARMLAENGDARGRFPTADSLACLAGVAPSTRQSGKVKAVTFRFGADKKLRDAICDFAGDSRMANPWAADLYAKAIGRGHDHPHAVRILGRAWIHIIWRCWQDHTAYDPANHGALQRVLNQDQETAA